jgi:hypothetical protein
VRRCLPLLPILAVLAGCAAADPEAAGTLRESEPLTAQCRQHFVADLHGRPAVFDSGPSVERDGDFTRIMLEAQPGDPDALHPYRYECLYEGSTLTRAGVQP